MADCSELITTVQKMLTTRFETIATAESCTGGILASWLTELPGSSVFFRGGASVYSNFAKTIFADVSAEFLENRGAVSPEVAEALASGIRSKLSADYGLATTGIAGPGGGSDTKPVGTVWCGVAGKNKTQSTVFHLEGDRDTIRKESSRRALQTLIEFVEAGN